MKENQSIGVLEYRSIALGMKAADDVLKSANVDIITATTVCPGKYIIIINGSVSSVKAAMERGTSKDYQQFLVDSCWLGNPHPDVIKGLHGATEVDGLEAIGIIETYSIASIFEVADDVVKTTPVQIVELRIAKGISGKSFVVFSGDLSSVEVSIEKAVKTIEDKGVLLQTAVIPRPDPRLWKEFV